MSTLALSIRQPWAWLIVNGWKDIENRSWPTRFHGKFLVHARKTCSRADWDDCYDTVRSIHSAGHAPKAALMMPEIEWFRDQECGGIVGHAEVVDCVEESTSPWFFGRFGFVLANAKPTKLRRRKGRLGFFEPQVGEAA